MSGEMTKRKLWAEREKAKRLNLINDTYGPVCEKSQITGIFLALDLFEICLKYNIPTSLSQRVIKSNVNALHKKLERRLFNYGYVK